MYKIVNNTLGQIRGNKKMKETFKDKYFPVVSPAKSPNPTPADSTVVDSSAVLPEKKDSNKKV